MLENHSCGAQVPVAMATQLYHGALRWESTNVYQAACCLDYLELRLVSGVYNDSLHGWWVVIVVLIIAWCQTVWMRKAQLPKQSIEVQLIDITVYWALCHTTPTIVTRLWHSPAISSVSLEDGVRFLCFVTNVILLHLWLVPFICRYSTTAHKQYKVK